MKIKYDNIKFSEITDEINNNLDLFIKYIGEQLKAVQYLIVSKDKDNHINLSMKLVYSEDIYGLAGFGS